MQEKNSLDTPVRYFKGVGPKKSDDLAALGIKTAEDILYYLPARYEDRSKIVKIRDLKMGEAQAIEGEIMTATSRRTKSGRSMFQASVTDRTGIIHAVWFNQPYLKDYLIKSAKVVLYGKVDRYDRVQIMSPEYEILKEGEAESIHMRRIVPVYPATGSLSVKYLRGLAFQAVMRYCRSLAERLPTYIIAREHLVDVRFAFRNIHFPATFDNLEKAYRRIVFEEFFMLQLALAIKKAGTKEAVGLGHKAGGGLMTEFKNSLPFELTGGQKKAIADIEGDMSSGKMMNRLLEGDVGSGKTVVAAHSLVMTVQNGFQGCLMAPTEVLARQHFIGLSELLMPLGINIALLVGGIDPETKSRLYSDIKDGTVNIVVGTHAIIQEAVEFKKLGLAVVDEQHKFGVDQRAILQSKGYKPHMLVMTATPIPRTLALTVYGDLDISVIKELPKGRSPIVTYWVNESKRDKAYDFIREEIEKGRQAYVVCPKIDESDTGPNNWELLPKNKVQNVTETFDRLKNEVFAGYEIGLLHGRMIPKEKEKVMKDFKKGKIKVLVSTVVIEVGIDVPNATVMLIENAERFGLSQLHQLRGRVGRGEHESYCILLADPKTDEASGRLKAIEGTLDGFQIAEADLEIRGPGEFFGTRQHGLPEIRFGNILKDFGIMELARKEAFDLVKKDPALKEEHHRLLKIALFSRFKDKILCE
ncbi:MAG: ATP-dependent DNA helicase RecG [Candidatus Omnitrophica bacterium]|nr:ATP-dependent DNA helicase RecG [Candidatus Omnitrophota bacterium]